MRSAWPITFDAKDSKSGETKEFEKRKASILIKMANLGVKIDHYYDPMEHRECSNREPEKRIHYILKGKGFNAVDCMWAYIGKIQTNKLIPFPTTCPRPFSSKTSARDFFKLPFRMNYER